MVCKGYGLRFKVMRCFKSFESANAFLDLRRTIYNFIGEMRQRAIPASIALELEKKNRLEGLIKISA